jgi:hypothetical protein
LSCIEELLRIGLGILCNFVRANNVHT